MSADFAPFERRMRAEGLPEIAIRSFRHYYGRLVRGERGLLPAAEVEPVDAVPEAPADAASREAGRAALPKAVVIQLNGGLGTSMGMTKAKSLLEVKEGLTFLDVIARQILALRRETGVRVPLLFMNSFRTRDDSRKLLSAYEDLSAGLPGDFLQHKVPRVRASDLAPAEWPEAPDYEWCPPGHGDLYPALQSSGLLERLLEAGYRYAFVSNADNLGATLDLGLLGWFAASGAPFAMEVKRRTRADRKGGHLARLRDGRLVLREIAQCPEEERTDFEDVARWRLFNTNNLWLDLEALRRALDEREGVLGLPMIANRKPVDPTDPGSPEVIQLETAMGAAVSVFEGARAVRVPEARFAPVKTTNELLAVRSDAFVLREDWRIEPADERRGSELVVDLDPRYYKRVDELEARFPSGPPSLVRCRRLAVRGDVRFGAAVVVEGDVEVSAHSENPYTVPSNSVLRGG